MKNHFDALPGSDDEENSGYRTVPQKDKQPQKQAPKKKEEAPKERQVNEVNAHLNLRQKEDLKVIRNPRQPRPNKEITDHHAHDPRSGTGRVSEPRKGGGGAGGIGNVKDELNQDKILGRVKEDNEDETETEKQPEPETQTLEEYYAKQGLNISQLDKKADQAAKKDPTNAEWIAKEKLTLMKTKADTNIEDDNRKTHSVKTQSHRVNANPDLNLLGFSNPGQNTNQGRKGGKQQNDKKDAKPVIKEEDFPSL